MRRWLPAAGLLFCGCVQPILPSGDAQRIALNACYVWPVPPAYRPFEKFFVLPDGTPAYKSLRQARSLDDSQGCDVSFLIDRQTSFTAMHWSAAIYAMPKREFLIRVAADDPGDIANPSFLAWAIDAALEPPEGAAYRKMNGLPPLREAAPAQATSAAASAAPQAVSSYAPPAVTIAGPAHERPALGSLTLRQAEAELLP